jgi:hypothetical protein
MLTVLPTYQQFIEDMKRGIPLFVYRDKLSVSETEFKKLLYQFSLDKENTRLYREVKLADAISMADDLADALQYYALEGVREGAKTLHIQAVNQMQSLLDWQLQIIGQLQGATADDNMVNPSLTADEYYKQLIQLTESNKGS